MSIKKITLLVAMTVATSDAASIVFAGSSAGSSQWRFAAPGLTRIASINTAVPNDPSVYEFADAATGVSFTVALSPVGGGWTVSNAGGAGIAGSTNDQINPGEAIDIVFSNEVGVLGPITISDGVFNNTDVEISGNSIVNTTSGLSGRLQGFTVNYTLIPEPSTGLLAGLAGLALVARRRR